MFIGFRILSMGAIKEMKINQAELEEAIETISDGGEALGVSCDDVYRCMISIDKFALLLCEKVHSGDDASGDFLGAFDLSARHLLIDALRAKMENYNGMD